MSIKQKDIIIHVTLLSRMSIAKESVVHGQNYVNCLYTKLDCAGISK